VAAGAVRKGRFALALLAVAVLALPGCTYLKYRGEDAMEMVDIGITWSSEPYWGIYGDCAAITPMGWSHVEGQFAGIGGGQIGVTRHYERAWGLLLLGHEEVGWGDYDRSDPQTLEGYGAGILGRLTPPYGRPSYTPACVHYLHLGYVGLVGNIRYMEMLDFLLGWAGLDIACDDGKRFSRWPWTPEPLQGERSLSGAEGAESL